MFAHMPNIAHLIGSDQAAKRFAVDRATFNRWVKAGKVPIAVKLEGATGARLFDADVIDRMVTERNGTEAGVA